MPARTAGTFSEHLRELRMRLFVIFLFFVAGGVLAYIYNVSILHAIQQSLHQPLYYTTPAGAFNLAMKISLIGGVVCVLPALMYNVIAFVQPALKRTLGKTELRLMTLLTLVLALSGAAFAYYLVVPMSLNFFRQFDVKGFQSLISATEYVNFVVNCVLIFVLLFQLPLFMLLIDRIRPVPPKRLWKLEKYVVIGSLVIALVLPFTYDPLTQFLIALPIIVLYNLSIMFIALAHRAQRRRDKAAEKRAIRGMPVHQLERHIDVNTVRLPSSAVSQRPAHVPQAVRSVDGFAPLRPGDVHRAVAAKQAQHQNQPAILPKPRLISDFVGQPIKRPVQYQRRGTSAVQPRRLDLAGFAINPTAGALQQASAES